MTFKDQDCIEDTIIIARPGQLLEEHLLGVAEKAKKFAAKIGLPEAGELIGLLHDFGKYSQEFQKYVRQANDKANLDVDDGAEENTKLKGKIDHSTAGAQWIWQTLRNYGQRGEGELCAQILALCVASHHGGLIDCLKLDGAKNFWRRMEKCYSQTNYLECCDSANEKILARANQLATSGLIMAMLRKITELLDRAKGELICDFNLGFFTRFLFSCLVDADRIDSASVSNPVYLTIQNRKIDWHVPITRLEQQLLMLKPINTIDHLRQKISDDCLAKAKSEQGIYTLTVPTGGGKTFASLRYALHHAQQHQLDRIIYIVPFTSIIEQNAEAIRKKIENASDSFPWVLEHHANLEPEKQTWHSKLASDNWESPIILTTMVQFLEVLFGGGTRGARRLHQLANSVLIFDEIQTLPIKCVHLFCNAINFLVKNTKTTAVLCTATQPLLTMLKEPKNGQLHLPENHELASDVEQLFIELERVEVVNRYKHGGWKDREIAELIMDEFKQKGNCLLIVNTKEWAQRVYQLCKEKIPQECLFHLSTNQYPVHRKNVLNQIRERLEQGLPVLCISTQLVEAGVDIDFASVVRFLAGLDSIAQAAGRCNRNGNLKNPQGELIKGTVHIINPDAETIESLIDIKAGRDNAGRVLNEPGEDAVLSLARMKRYFHYYFFERDEEMVYPFSDHKTGTNTLLNLLASNEKNVGYAERIGKFPLLQQSFKQAGQIFEALDAPTHAVIVPHAGGKEIVTALCQAAKEYNPVAYYELLKKAQKYSVNIFPNVWKELQQQGAIYEIQNEGIYYLDERYYSDEFGLSTEPVALMSFNVV